jgi:predicted O-methyltransferase YrrM
MNVLTHYLMWSAGLARPTTQTSEAERACLAGHAAGRMRLAEVGVWHGVTTCVLRRSMASGAVLFAVDPYPAGRLGVSFQRRIARRNVARMDKGRVEWLRMTGSDAAKYLAENHLGPVDFAFIDGDHSYDGLRSDWEGWSPLAAPGGIIALHDSRSSATRPIDNAGSARYTRDVIRGDSRFELIDEVDTLSVFRRRSLP